ncbi:MAG: TetR/AcrR family transcriptional regulator [Desulfuromonadales bacterium]|nr:TetR/AcrR family transcriptional regulator [Desulfuromonadales bacterium]
MQMKNEQTRKEQIFAGALKIISEQGTQNVTLDHVSKACGFSRGGITYYYSSKDELFKDVFAYFFERFFDQFETRLRETKDPYEKLLSFAWLYAEDNPDLSIGYPLFFECMSLANYNEEYSKIYDRWVARWVSLVKEALQECITHNKITVEDIDSTALLIAAITQGIASRWYLNRAVHSTAWALESYKRAVGSLLDIQL